MKLEVDDLPEAWQQELQRVLRIVFEEFERSLATATQPWKKAGRVLKVLLCRSSPTIPTAGVLGLPSSFDLLIVVNDERLTAFSDYWSPVEDRLLREKDISLALRSGVSLLVYSLTEVNQYLNQGTPFFVDLVSDGIVLYDHGGSTFARPRRLPASQARSAAQRYFDFWFPMSLHARQLARLSIEHGVPRDAAFLFHQAVERAYHCLLLVLTLHSPKTHRLELLRSNSERRAPLLTDAWPSAGKFERRCFERLRRSYLEARYSEDFRISRDELAWIDERVGILQELIRIEKAIHDLPTLTRRVFVARRVEKLEYEQISRRLGLTVHEVEERVALALDAVARSPKVML